jgi:hypothetical protein
LGEGTLAQSLHSPRWIRFIIRVRCGTLNLFLFSDSKCHNLQVHFAAITVLELSIILVGVFHDGTLRPGGPGSRHPLTSLCICTLAGFPLGGNR